MSADKLVEKLTATPYEPNPEIVATEESRFSVHDPLSFDGTLFATMDKYKADMLASADNLRQRVGITRALGDLDGLSG